ncbi:MAG: putative LPS assembly protein LptD, partial [Candidatus Latescibacterota bacterium]
GFSTSLSSSNKIRGWLVAEPSLNLSENFTLTNSDSDSIKYRRRDNLTFGMGLGTTVYGTFQPTFGNVRGLRHVISPTANWSFGKNRQHFADSPDAFLRFDRNDADNPLVNRLDLNLRNIFQVKTQNGDQENKFDLFTLNFGTGVDFEAKERKISPLQTTLDFRPTRVISTRLSASHSFYDSRELFSLFDPTLENLTLTTDVGITRESLRFLSASSRPGYNSSLGRDDLDLDTSDVESAEGIDTGTSSLPFNLRFSHTYGIRRDFSRPGKYVTTHDIKPEISFSPTRNFSVNYFLYYDLANKELVSHRLSLNRDLHCFEASLNWIPSGIQEGFYFRVNIKDLPDVKLERRRGSSRLGY